MKFADEVLGTHKPAKDVGFGLDLPIYMSGPSSIGWWAMFITMLADATAFASLAFAYFFYWATHSDFPPATTGTIALIGYGIAALSIATSWALTIMARHWNNQSKVTHFHLSLVAAMLVALLGGAALVAAPLADGLDPRLHAYPAIVWVLALWAAIHVAIGFLMQAYCMARSLAGRLTAYYDIDMQNVALYWHFAALTGILATMVVALFPYVA